MWSIPNEGWSFPTGFEDRLRKQFDPDPKPVASPIRIFSDFKDLGRITFPKFTGVSCYMGSGTTMKFLVTKNPSILMSLRERDLNLMDLDKRWKRTLTQVAVKVPGLIHFKVTIDEKSLKKGEKHRRGGPHVDGNWVEANTIHKHAYNYKEAHLEVPKIPTSGGLLLASTHAGCRAWMGTVEGWCGDGGDCSHLDLSKIHSEVLKPNHLYWLNITGIHESIPVEEDCDRQLLRITLPEEFPPLE